VAICFILRKFGIFYVHLLHYPHFGILYKSKSGSPGFEAGKKFFRASVSAADACLSSQEQEVELTNSFWPPTLNWEMFWKQVSKIFF
jgi:hypothetical protein